MKIAAIEQAGQRLDRAERALHELEAATNYEEAESAWSDFLLATSTIYTKLEQGAKSAGPSQAWFGRKKKERRDNPVLKYLHFARNSDEHGVERVTERQLDSNSTWASPMPFWHREAFEAQFLDGETKEPIGDKTTAWLTGPRISLVRAKDSRYGDFCDPPKLPSELPNDPISVAKAAIPMLQDLLEQAAKLV